MDGITVRGRGLPAPEVNVRVRANGVQIRIDDSLNPEFWMELELPAGVLAEMLARVSEANPKSHTDEPGLFRMIAKTFPR
jgi:hypothetical protein